MIRVVTRVQGSAIEEGEVHVIVFPDKKRVFLAGYDYYEDGTPYSGINLSREDLEKILDLLK